MKSSPLLSCAHKLHRLYRGMCLPTDCQLQARGKQISSSPSHFADVHWISDNSLRRRRRTRLRYLCATRYTNIHFISTRFPSLFGAPMAAGRLIARYLRLDRESINVMCIITRCKCIVMRRLAGDFETRPRAFTT